ncbi:MAG: hypothetical protein ACRCX2_34665, partial [Paraclostridium sp.]
LSFNKITFFKTDADDFEIIDGELIKTASVKLPDGIDYDPDYLYMRVKAVSAGESWGANKNNDYFPEIELKNNYKTFLSAHVFKNHENKKIEAAVGDVITAEWSDNMKCVYLLIRVDKKIAPSIVRGFEKGFMTDVSMGCRVDHVVCSYCGKKAKTRLDYCDHLKTMKGKIMDNGKKVYEINISPKFHDISVVLNGAERTAKAEKIYTEGTEKTASEAMEKVAFETSTHNLFDYLGTDNQEKIASDNGSLSSNYVDSDMEVIASMFNTGKEKLSDTQKIAEFKKQLQGKIEGLAANKVAKDNLDNFEKISSIIKLLYTKYWDKKKCAEIAVKLKDIASENRASLEVTFDQFLKVADFAGVELSPLEIHDIFHELVDVDTYDTRRLNVSELNHNNIKCNEELSSKLAPKGCMVSVLNRARTIADDYDNYAHSFNNGSPALKAKIVLSGSHGSDNILNDSIITSIMDRILKCSLADRSHHRQFLMPRLVSISKGLVHPDAIRGAHHNIPINSMRVNSLGVKPSFTLPLINAGIIHSKYQDDRINRLNSGELEKGMKKIAYYLDTDPMEKIAESKPLVKFSPGKQKTIKITPTRAALAGIPITYAYSALQRSRANNGEDISSLNRYVAENPGNAALMQAMLTKNVTSQVPTRAKDAIGKASKKISNADMFKAASIDSLLFENGYDENSVNVIKYACTLEGIGMEDKAEDLLLSKGLGFDDVSEYLKTAESYYKIEIEKNAGAIKDISTSVIGDVLLDNPKKTSVAAAMPGYLFDGLALAGIGKGLQIAANKDKKGDLKNV